MVTLFNSFLTKHVTPLIGHLFELHQSDRVTIFKWRRAKNFKQKGQLFNCDFRTASNWIKYPDLKTFTPLSWSWLFRYLELMRSCPHPRAQFACCSQYSWSHDIFSSKLWLLCQIQVPESYILFLLLSSFIHIVYADDILCQRGLGQGKKHLLINCFLPLKHLSLVANVNG